MQSCKHKCSLVWHTLTCAMDLHAPSCSCQHIPIPKDKQGWGKKARGPRKAASHLCSRFNDWLQRESALEARNFFPEWQVSLSSHIWTRLLHSETHDDKITQRTMCLRGCTKTSKQYPSPPFLCTQNVTAELLLLLSLRTTCLCYSKVFACHSSQTHLKTCLWSQDWSELLRFGDHLLQNENLPYSWIQMQLWQGRSSHCTATQHKGVLYELAMLLSPFPYYNQGTCKGSSSASLSTFNDNSSSSLPSLKDFFPLPWEGGVSSGENKGVGGFKTQTR